MTVIDINFFSYSTLSVNGQSVKIPFAKAEGLLYCLIVNKRMSKETLCHLLWGDCGEEMAKKSLRNAIYTLRRQLGEDIIVAESQSLLALGANYRVNSDLHYLMPEYQPENLADIPAFIDFYQQDFLSHFVIKNALEFTEWVYFEQEKYRRLYMEKLDRMALNAEAAGEKEQAQKCLYKLITCEPFEERYYLRLVKLLLSGGKLPEAIKLYTKLETLLKEELFIQPGAELADLIGTAIKEQLISGGRGEFFYGREQELAELKQNFISFAEGGRYHSYVFIGEAGIGKTCLLDKFVEGLSGDFILFDICNYLIDKDFAYKMWEDIFRQICFFVEQKKLDIPEWQLQSLQNVPAHRTLEETPLHSQLLQLMENVTRQHKVVLVIDDLQWVDESSIELLLKVLLRCKNLLLAATVRDHQEETLPSLLYGLKNRHALRQIRLTRFSPEQTDDFVRHLAPELTAHSELIYRESEGIPFFITEMVNNYRAGVDIRVLNQQMKDFIGARVSTLGHTEQAVLNMCAAINGDIRMELLEALSGVGDIELLEILEVLMHKQIIKEFLNGQGEPVYCFSHPKIREYVYGNVSLAKRAILHEKIADALEALYGGDKRRQIYYPRLIYHYTEAGNVYKVLKYRIAHLEAQIKLQNEMFPVQLGVEEIGISSYYSPDQDLTEEFAELKRLLADPKLNCTEQQQTELTVRYYYLQGRYYNGNSMWAAGEEMMQKMLAMALDAGDEALIAYAYIRLILQAVDNYDLARILLYAADAAKLPYIQNNLEYALTLNHYQGYAYILQGRHKQGEALLKQNIVVLESMSSRQEFEHILAADYFCLAESRLRQQDVDTAEQYLFTARSYCRNNQIHSSRAIINLGLGIVKYMRRDYVAAARVLALSEEAYLRNGFLWHRLTLYCYLAKTALKLGELERAATFAQKCLDLCHATQNNAEQQLVDSMRRELAEAGIKVE